MIKVVFLAMIVCFTAAMASECQQYELSHPAWLLDGQHLQSGKCTSCSFCHKSGVFMGTPTACKICHVANSGFNAVSKPKDHPTTVTVNKQVIVVANVDCNNGGQGGCHNTRTFDK